MKLYRLNYKWSKIWQLLIILLIVSCSNHFHLEKRRYTRGWYFKHMNQNRERQTLTTRGFTERNNNETELPNNDQEQNVASINKNKITDLGFLKVKPEICIEMLVASTPDKDFKKEKETKNSSQVGIKNVNSKKNFDLYRKSDSAYKVIIKAILAVFIFFLIFVILIWVVISPFGFFDTGIAVFGIIALLSVVISILLTKRIKL